MVIFTEDLWIRLVQNRCALVFIAHSLAKTQKKKLHIPHTHARSRNFREKSVCFGVRRVFRSFDIVAGCSLLPAYDEEIFAIKKHNKCYMNVVLLRGLFVCVCLYLACTHVLR